MGFGISEHHTGVLNVLEYQGGIRLILNGTNNGLVLFDEQAGTNIAQLRRESDDDATLSLYGDGTEYIRLRATSPGFITQPLSLGSGAVPDSNAILDLTSTTKGFLLPRLTTTQRNTLSGLTPTGGTMIFNTTTSKLEVYNGSTGFEAVTSTGP